MLINNTYEEELRNRLRKAIMEEEFEEVEKILNRMKSLGYINHQQESQP